MAKVDYKSLGMDTKLGRKYKYCAKCREESAVTVLCPLREKSRNPYVCVYCCWKCGFSRQTPQGRVCSILVNRKEKEREEQQRIRAGRKIKKAGGGQDAEQSFL
ncbi:MAG: hypothetical protein IKY90_00285 [Oscillospiraceae bacterium]|nr:hypothetical protein [Oscillospiraceae bacterium]